VNGKTTGIEKTNPKKRKKRGTVNGKTTGIGENDGKTTSLRRTTTRKVKKRKITGRRERRLVMV